MTDLLTLSIVGAIASVLTQIIKTKLPDGLPRAIFAIVISLILGLVAYWLNFVPALKEALIGTLLISNIFYQAIIKHLLKEE